MCSSIATTRSGVGGTTGSPSVSPRSKQRLERVLELADLDRARADPPVARARRGREPRGDLGSRVRLAQPGRNSGRPSRSSGSPRRRGELGQPLALDALHAAALLRRRRAAAPPGTASGSKRADSASSSSSSRHRDEPQPRAPAPAVSSALGLRQHPDGAPSAAAASSAGSSWSQTGQSCLTRATNSTATVRSLCHCDAPSSRPG